MGPSHTARIKGEPSSRIADNPTAKELRTMLPLFQFLGSAAGFAAKLGIKREAMTAFKSAVDDLKGSADILDLPDRFNTTFAASGWVATGSLAADVMRTAIDLHASGQFESAEGALLEWFTENNIQLFAITRARRFHVAHSRDEQLQEALRLYLEERYMAAVPLILIACDGFASDVTGTSPFEKNADLTCFDSITGHPTALPALIKLLVQGVRKSTDAELSIPKRHGILHGRALGYANKVVCAKAWLLMVALVDWAGDKLSEEARMEEHRKKENVSLRDALEISRRTQRDKQIIEAFRPTENTGPITGPYGSDTAEYALLEFLEGWKQRNFGRMAKHATNLTGKPANKMAGEIRNMAEFITLEEYDITRIRHSTVARYDIRVQIRASTLSKTVSGAFNLLLFRYTSTGEVAMPTEGNASWVVQQNCIYNVMSENFADSA